MDPQYYNRLGHEATLSCACGSIGGLQRKGREKIAP